MEFLFWAGSSERFYYWEKYNERVFGCCSFYYSRSCSFLFFSDYVTHYLSRCFFLLFFYLFFCGFIAIIAMILPGVSGAFILLLLGAYGTAIDTVNLFIDSVRELNWSKFSDAFLNIMALALGAILGLKVFSRMLNWMFSHKKNLTLAVLTGFMIGSLNKIWPWKKTLSWYTDSHGVEVPLVEKSVSPYNYEGDPELIWTIILAIAGFLIIFLLEQVATKKV